MAHFDELGFSDKEFVLSRWPLARIDRHPVTQYYAVFIGAQRDRTRGGPSELRRSDWRKTEDAAWMAAAVRARRERIKMK
jgi:hypothetical protein